MTIALAFSNLLWLGLVLSTKAAAERFGLSISQGLHLDTPEFWAEFSTTLRRLLNPSVTWKVVGEARLLVLLLTAGLVVFIWLKSDLPSESNGWRSVFGTLATLPSITGLSMGPGLIRASFKALSDAGLSNPGLIGIGVAEAFAPLILGAMLVVPLLLVFLGLFLAPKRRREPG